MKDFFALLELKPSTSDEHLVRQIQTSLGNPDKRNASLDDYLSALLVFSNAYLSKIYRASLRKKNIPTKWKATLEREMAKVENSFYAESEIVYHFKESSFWLANFWFILGRCLCLPLSRKNNSESPGRNLLRLILLSVAIQLALFHLLPILLIWEVNAWFSLLYGSLLFYLIRKEYYQAKIEHSYAFFARKGSH